MEPSTDPPPPGDAAAADETPEDDAVPDVRAPGFAAEAHRQSALTASAPHAADDQAFVDSLSWLDDTEDEEADVE